MKQAAPTWFLQVSSLQTDDSIIAPSDVEEKTANSQERLKREFVSYLEQLTKIHPVVLFFEDLHWADLSTVDLLSYLGTRCGDLRLLLVVTYRPSALQAASHPFRSVQLEMQSHDLAFEINLDYLDQKSIEQYLAQEFEGHDFPPDFVHLIHKKTEGHPLFMADLLRDLKNRGIVVGAAGNWKLAANLKDIAHDMPVSTRSMIERTIEHLPEEDRQILRVGALQGAEFDSAVVCHVLTRGEDEIEDRLERVAKTYGLIEMVSEREFRDGTLTLRYRFSHALYQNALTDSLALTRRSRWSLQIAKHLEALYRDQANDSASELAFLFEQGRDLTVASSYYYSAALNAARVFASREVAVLARRGLDCLQRLPESDERAAREITLALLLGAALTQTRGFGDPEVLQVYDEATALCQSHGVPAQQLNAMRGLWAFHLVRAEYRKARSLAGLLTELANRTDDPVARVEACLAVGFTDGYLGNAVSSAESFRTALGIEVPRTKTERTFMFALDNAVACRTQLSTQLWYLGYPDEALAQANRAHTQAKSNRSPYDIGFTMMQCATVHRLRREFTQTQQRGGRGSPVCDRARPARNHGLVAHAPRLVTRVSRSSRRRHRAHEEVPASAGIGGIAHRPGQLHGGTGGRAARTGTCGRSNRVPRVRHQSRRAARRRILRCRVAPLPGRDVRPQERTGQGRSFPASRSDESRSRPIPEDGSCERHRVSAAYSPQPAAPKKAARSSNPCSTGSQRDRTHAIGSRPRLFSRPCDSTALST